MPPPAARRRVAVGVQALRDGGARLSWGKGRSPGVTLWLGEDEDPKQANPVSLSIYTGVGSSGISINFTSVRDKRDQGEMQRLAGLMRGLPGVAGYIEGLEAQGWGMHRGMDPADVLPSDGAVDPWISAVNEAARRK